MADQEECKFQVASKQHDSSSPQAHISHMYQVRRGSATAGEDMGIAEGSYQASREVLT